MRIEKRKRKRKFALIAMADIAFLLLVFLIVTSSMNDEGDIVLPLFNFTEKSVFADTLSIAITTNGDLRLNGVSIARENLVRELSKLPRTRGKAVQLAADRDTKYSDVDFVLSSLREAELYRIVLTAERENEK